jgi:hypothetical protein
MSRRTPHETARRRALADAASGWASHAFRRGDLVYDPERDCFGVVVALPEDTGASLYYLRPEGGGVEWTASRLVPHPDDAPDGFTLAESVMPPRGIDPEPTHRRTLDPTN